MPTSAAKEWLRLDEAWKWQISFYALFPLPIGGIAEIRGIGSPAMIAR